MFIVKPFEASDYVEVTKGEPTSMGIDPLDAGKMYKAHGPAVTGFYNGTPVICAGIAIPWKGLGEMWAVLSPDAPKCHLAINRAARKFLWAMVNEADLRRVQATVEITYLKGIRWAEWLGFKVDGVAEKYGPNGEDFVRYVLFPKES